MCTLRRLQIIGEIIVPLSRDLPDSTLIPNGFFDSCLKRSVSVLKPNIGGRSIWIISNFPSS